MTILYTAVYVLSPMLRIRFDLVEVNVVFDAFRSTRVHPTVDVQLLHQSDQSFYAFLQS